MCSVASTHKINRLKLIAQEHLSKKPCGPEMALSDRRAGINNQSPVRLGTEAQGGSATW